ncbi:MAG: hypothetical protein EBS76_11645, partial [Actinobacteria bacterium]|nr:hypothetical protein [Actinomycetota bacterium]
WTDGNSGDRIVRYYASDEGDEATFVASTARQLTRETGAMFSDTAVLYRTNAQSRVIEESFMRLGVPYQVVGGTKFYDRREVRDALAYLRVVANPADEVSVKRVLNVPKRGVGDTSVARIDEFASQEGLSFLDAARRASEAGVSGRAARGVESFCEVVDSARELLLREGDDGLTFWKHLVTSPNSKRKTPLRHTAELKTWASLLVLQGNSHASTNSLNRLRSSPTPMISLMMIALC